MERRKKQDIWAKLLLWLNMISWIVLVIILLVFHRAQPEFESFFDRFYQLSLRTHWDHQFLYFLTCSVLVGIVISIVGLCLGVYRARRKNDHKKALIVTGIVSIILLIVTNFLI